MALEADGCPEPREISSARERGDWTKVKKAWQAWSSLAAGGARVSYDRHAQPSTDKTHEPAYGSVYHDMLIATKGDSRDTDRTDGRRSRDRSICASAS